MIGAPRRWWLVSAILLAGATAFAAPAASAQGAPTSNAKHANPKAESRAQARAQAKKGQLDYKLARFEQALEDYTYAYELYPAPALLFNLGQCYRNLKNYERAIFFFDGYLREQPKIDRDQRALTEDLIAECKSALERQNNDAAEAAARLAAPPMATLAAAQEVSARLALRSPPSTMESPSLVALNRDRPPHETSVTHRWWFWTAIVGTALAAGAVAYYATGDPRLVAPSGSVGTLDRR